MRKVRAADPYMAAAIEEAYEGIENGHGGPFGTVIVKDGKIVGRGHNVVLKEHDSTAHGEISAIRDAEKRMQTHDLSGCELYTTGEPCPMCLFACLWAKVDHIYYGCNLEDNSSIGFRDEELEKMVSGRESLKGYLTEKDREACLALFEDYRKTAHELY